eukprot:tig00000498_g1641.t1
MSPCLPCPYCRLVPEGDYLDLEAHIRRCVAERRATVQSETYPKFCKHPLFPLLTTPPTPEIARGCPDATEIADGIFLGGARSAKDHSWLFRAKIRTILNMANDVNSPLDVYSKLGISFKRIPCADHSSFNMRPMFEEAFAFLDTAPRPAYVHCAVGVSRSATIVIAYLMAKKKLSLVEAFTLVREKRPIVYPNKGLLLALLLFERELVGEDRASAPLDIVDLHFDPTPMPV